MSFKYKTAAIFLAVVFLLLFDRWLKILAVKGLAFELVEKILSFNFTKNYGIAFSLPVAKSVVIILVLIIIGYLLRLLFESIRDCNLINVMGYFLVIAGALSNLFDRIMYGYVIDYLEVRYFSVLNLADVMIFCGVVAVLWTIIKKKPIIL